jgi:hypothetical protein
MIETVKDLTSFKWATVTATSPLAIKLDGDTAPLALIPDSLVDPLLLSAGDRVRVELSQRKVVIHGVSRGEDRVISAKLGTDLPSTYPVGLSVMSISAEAGWPSSLLTVTTSRVGTFRTSQTAIRKVSGQTWVRSEDNNTWGPWYETAAPGSAQSYGGGLIKIKPTDVVGGGTIDSDGDITLNTASGWRIEGCFPSDFNRFRIVWLMETASQAGLSFQLSAGSSADSSANYDAMRMTTGGAGTPAGASTDNGTFWFMDGGSSGHQHTAIFDVFNPNLSEATYYSGQFYTRRIATPSFMAVSAQGGTHQLGTVYDGFRLFTSTGNASGKVQVYGYR